MHVFNSHLLVKISLGLDCVCVCVLLSVHLLTVSPSTQTLKGSKMMTSCFSSYLPYRGRGAFNNEFACMNDELFARGIFKSDS